MELFTLLVTAVLFAIVVGELVVLGVGYALGHTHFSNHHVARVVSEMLTGAVICDIALAILCGAALAQMPITGILWLVLLVGGVVARTLGTLLFVLRLIGVLPLQGKGTPYPGTPPQGDGQGGGGKALSRLRAGLTSMQAVLTSMEAALEDLAMTLPPQGGPTADGYDSPVGTEAERRSAKVWPGAWFDATGYGTRYTDSAGHAAFHTGADLNLPGFGDTGLPVYSSASGVVIFAGFIAVWGNVVVIRHDPLPGAVTGMYGRYAHLGTVSVASGERVNRGQAIGTIGNPPGSPPNKNFHLHFDLSPTEALLRAGDWPGLDQVRLRRDYVDPRLYINTHRPGAVGIVP